jgi:hypothetical protein
MGEITETARAEFLRQIERRRRIVGLATSAGIAAGRSRCGCRRIAGSGRCRCRCRSGRGLVGRLRAAHPRAGRNKYRRS